MTNAIKDTLNGEGKSAGEMLSDLERAIPEQIQKTRHYVKRNPVAGIFMATGAGVVLGSILTMSMRKRV